MDQIIAFLTGLLKSEFAQRALFSGLILLAVVLSHRALEKDIKHGNEKLEQEIAHGNEKLDNHITDTIKKIDKMDSRFDKFLEHLIKKK